MRALLLVILLTAALPAAADTLDELLESVRQGQAESRVINAEREARFARDRDAQARLLKEAEAQVSGFEREANLLRRKFTANEKDIAALKDRLAEQSGDLEQLKSVVRQAAADAQGALAGSLVSIEFTDRLEPLAAVAASERLPTISDIETLWFELQREMTENGRISRFEAEQVDALGMRSRAQVTRYGVFSVRDSDGRYLEYRPDTAQLEQLPRQPRDWGGLSALLGEAGSGVVIDPTRGSLFALLDERPSIAERVQQGGIVGFVILGLGAIGVVLAVVQFLYLMITGAKMRAQRRRLHQPSSGNPLGRVLGTRVGLPADLDLESLELAIDEAILKETPRLERLQGAIKLLAAVAPLLGLLGTVTGMIETFQAITLFGTGDPKLMAGGISQALVTTVLGLVVAIPLLFLHSVITARSRVLVQMLDEQSAGLMAQASAPGVEAANA